MSRQPTMCARSPVGSFLSLWFLLLLWCNLLPTNEAQQAVAADTFTTEPARVSCNAAYSAPCARTNSEWFAMYIVNNFENIDEAANTLFDQINEGFLVWPIGFYPFVFNRNTSECVAHGSHPEYVGLSLDHILSTVGVGFSDADQLHKRFTVAADMGGGWVQYLWSDGGRANSKLSYVVPFGEQYYLGVGYENTQLPPDLPCSDKTDAWCSMTNIRSLLGKAQFRLSQAESIESFEAAVFDLSYDAENFVIPGGFYTFLYNYDGSLKAHARLHDYFGQSLADIMDSLGIGTRSEGESLHDTFVLAAGGFNDGWVKYPWRNSLEEDLYSKIAYIVPITFEDEQYYLGAGFNFAMGEVPKGPLNEECSPEYNLPCSFNTALQLTSHSLAHSITAPAGEVFYDISTNPEFRRGEFYVFMYQFEDEICVAHGLDNSYVGMTLTEVFSLNNIPLDATELHKKFMEAAVRGGGWVLYDWLVPNVPGSEFEKISYIFKMNLNGQDYYGGVGLNHKRSPTLPTSSEGLNNAGEKISCTSRFNLDCSEINTQALLGQAVADLTLASTDARVTTSSDSSSTVTLQDTLASITDQNSLYTFNDFYTAVFALDGAGCETFDGSGCCVAHGSDPLNVGLTWQQILDKLGITSIRGTDLHSRLVSTASSSGAASLEYPWSSDSGDASTKRSWTARFRDGRDADSREFYVVSEFLKESLPPTCDRCPGNMECTSRAQEFCKLKPPPPFTQQRGFKIALSFSIIVVLILVAVTTWTGRRYRRSKRKKQALKDEMNEMAKRMESQAQGMFEVVHDLHITDPDTYARRFGSGDGESCRMPVVATWYWEEDSAHLSKHDASKVLSGTNFVRYHQGSSDQLEHAFRRFQEGNGFALFSIDLTNKVVKVNNADTGARYEVNFETLKQRNEKSDFQRSIHRVEHNESVGSAIRGDLPPLPLDIDFSSEAEDLLSTYKGQVIQVSKVHQDGAWMFGNVLYDPLVNDAKNREATSSAGLNSALAAAIHDRPTSGWFPKAVVDQADMNVMQKLVGTIGAAGLDALIPPPTWDDNKDGLVAVQKGTTEYNKVADYFITALYGQKDRFKVVNVERVQNLPLWQSYSVKLETMKARDLENPQYLKNNKDLGGTERKWLFHGSMAEVIPKIVKQGFNRAFAGRNAVAFGKGAYFARDSSYSCHETYSKKDRQGVQRMFLCRVAVGDWCRGQNGQLTPDPKPHNPMELFDTTVDNPSNPSIFVVYHDAQAYPEYLVSFKHK